MTSPGGGIPSDYGATRTEAEPLNITPISPPAPQTLVYSPDVQILIARGNKQYDVSADVVAFSIRRIENGVSSAVFRLTNKALPGNPKKLRYAQLFERMDRVVIRLKRVEWVQVFSGYLDQVPYVQLYPGTVNFRASCTLKRLMHTWWDPGLYASQEIFNQPGVSQQETINGEQQLDRGLGSLLRRLLVNVGGWDSQNIHIQRFPVGFFLFMNEELRKTSEGTQIAAQNFRELLLGAGDTSLGPGRSAGLQSGVTMGNYTLTAPERMAEVIRAVDEMGMGPDTTDLAASQGLGTVAASGKDQRDQEFFRGQQEVGRNWSDAALKSDAAIHAFMTIMVESNWVMYANAAVPESLTYPHEALSTDGTSVGLYQQQNFGEWGNVSQRMNVKASTQMFLQHLNRLDWRNMDRGAACQAVQRSAKPWRYAEFEAAAIEAVRALRSGTGTAQGAGGPNNTSPTNPLAGASLGATPVGTVTPPITAGPLRTGGLPSTPTTNGTPTVMAATTQVGKPAYDTGGALSCAIAQIGKPYVWGQRGPASFDCIAEGSLVMTDRGEIPIESVTTRDQVLTRKGFRRVLRAWKVRDDADLAEIAVNGRTLQGTPDHRVWTENRGWVALGEITEFDTVVSCQNRSELNFWESPITGTQNLTDHLCERISSVREKAFIEPFTSTITAPSQTVTRCTISTTTRSTTSRTTLLPCPSLNTALKVRPTASCTTTSVPCAGSSFRPTVHRSVNGDSVLVSTSRNITTTLVRQKKSVYDLTVEGEHEFFANGVLVHNCSGLMQFCYRSIGLEIGGTTYEQAGRLQRIPASNLVPGDIIQPTADHTVMYMGPGQIIHAPQAGDVVRAASIYFDLNTAVCYRVPGAEFGGTIPAPFDIARAISTSNAIAGTSTTGLNGTTGTGQTEPIARNLFTYQFMPGQFTNYISSLFGNEPGTEEKAFINDEPLIQTVISFAEAGLRNFQSAPNGDFIAYYPDYFGLDGKDAVWTLEDIEMKNVQIDLNDDALTTHVYVAGSASPVASGGDGVPGWLASQGVATVENRWLYERMTLAAPRTIGDGLIDGNEIMSRYGVRPLVKSMSSVMRGPMEFLLAVQTFMTKWAEQYSTQIETTFMPEVFPGMRLHLPNHGLQVYVREVTHSGDFESGFTTSMTIMAPSNPNIRKMAESIFKATYEQIASGMALLSQASEVVEQ